MPRLCSLVPTFPSSSLLPRRAYWNVCFSRCSFVLSCSFSTGNGTAPSALLFPFFLVAFCVHNKETRERGRGAFLLHIIVSLSPYLFFFFSPPPCSYTSVRSLWLCLSCGFCFCFMYFFFRFFHLSSTFCCCFGALEKASLFCNQLECKHFCMHIVLLLLLLYFGFVSLLLQVEYVCC